jgi:hypothetical protein
MAEKEALRQEAAAQKLVDAAAAALAKQQLEATLKAEKVQRKMAKQQQLQQQKHEVRAGQAWCCGLFPWHPASWQLSTYLCVTAVDRLRAGPSHTFLVRASPSKTERLARLAAQLCVHVLCTGYI